MAYLRAQHHMMGLHSHDVHWAHSSACKRTVALITCPQGVVRSSIGLVVEFLFHISPWCLGKCKVAKHTQNVVLLKLHPSILHSAWGLLHVANPAPGLGISSSTSGEWLFGTNTHAVLSKFRACACLSTFHVSMHLFVMESVTGGVIWRAAHLIFTCP